MRHDDEQATLVRVEQPQRSFEHQVIRAGARAAASDLIAISEAVIRYGEIERRIHEDHFKLR